MKEFRAAQLSISYLPRFPADMASPKRKRYLYVLLFLFRIACAPLLFSALLPTLRELVNSGQRKLLIRLYTLGPKVPLPFFFVLFLSLQKREKMT